MRYIIVLISLSLGFFHFSDRSDNGVSEILFLVNENNRYGFINEEGEEVIKTIYRSAGEFSEGLANVRIDGTHGYINKLGEMVIAPQFDFGNPFKWGLAKVYKDGIPFFINKKGIEKSEYNVYTEIKPVNENLAVVETKSDKFGGIDKSGNLIIDTIYNSIYFFDEEQAIASILSSSKPEKWKVGVIDTAGNVVIPIGQYYDIRTFGNRHFKVKYSNDKGENLAALTDKAGKIILEMNSENNCSTSDNLYCGLIKLNCYGSRRVDSLGRIITSNFYQGFMNLKGETIINDNTFRRVSNFSFNRAIIQDNARNQFIIKTNGERIEADSIDKIHSHQFINGLAIASYQKRSGIIDTNGVYIIKPTFKGITGLYDGYFAFFQDGFYGIKDLQGKTIVEPIMKSFDRNGFKDGLLKSVIDKRTAYVNRRGEVVWKSSTYAHYKYFQRNIDYIKTTDYNVYKNKNLRKENSKKIYSKEIENNNKFPEDSLSVVIEKISLIDKIKNKNYRNARSYFVHVANRLDTPIQFGGFSGRIKMKAQAKDKNGIWRDIEKEQTGGFCGNSIFREYLNPNQYWTFMTPEYQGDFKTTLRIALKYVNPAATDNVFKKWDTITIYSNEYPGSVNPAQFWR